MTTQTQPTRVCIRLPCEIPAEIIFSGGGSEHIKKATISNISTTGIQILCPSFIATGQTLEARFKVPGQNSKTTLRAEVMRIESLQGRMIGHYPYALGAKFVTSEKKQEKQITRFISGKMTCTSLRGTAAWLLLILGVMELGRTLLHSIPALSDLSALDLYGFAGAIQGNWIMHPALSGLAALGCLSSAVFCVLNKNFFVRLGIFWAAAQIVYSLIILSLKWKLLAGGLSDKIIWSAELLPLFLGIGSIAIIIKFTKELKKMNLLLSAGRAPSAPDRPTFTIL